MTVSDVSYICMYYLGVLPVSWQYKESVFDKKQEKGTTLGGNYNKFELAFSVYRQAQPEGIIVIGSFSSLKPMPLIMDQTATTNQVESIHHSLETFLSIML